MKSNLSRARKQAVDRHRAANRSLTVAAQR
jgi:hypothetical protein